MAYISNSCGHKLGVTEIIFSQKIKKKITDAIIEPENQTFKHLNISKHLGESVTQTQIWKIKKFWNFIFCHLNIVRV